MPVYDVKETDLFRSLQISPVDGRKCDTASQDTS
jgi:hypothetical protein